ncbi:BnaC07g06740D [Brassica napus]|uniref:BnaC07g06740D protein n=1 Tax=Brassica napus TaxID=3708 RepID=A0A078G2U0_BRANA|nr:BnaC07g06740D [Brassica napus]
MGARNTRASQSPLHSKIEALIWAIECMRNLRQFWVTFATDCGLCSIGEDGFGTRGVASLCKLFGGHNFLKRSFNSSEIIHIPRTHNSRAGSLARSARKQRYFVVHMDAELPVWFAESI